MTHGAGPTPKTPDIFLERSRGWLLRNVVLPAGDVILRRPMLRRLRYLEAAQWWSSERLATARDQLVAAVIRTAYNDVPIYRQLMEGVGISPADVVGATDLPRVPTVTKAMLRAGYPNSTCRATGRRTYEVSTSGSTGTNFRVREDAPTAAWYRASFLLALGWAGWRFGEPHLQTGMNLERGLERRLKDLFFSSHYVSAFDLTDHALDRNLALLEKHQMEHLWGFPGSLYFLARRAARQGWNRPLKSVVTWGDNLVPSQRRAIEAAFGTRVHDTYGCAEGIQVAAQCGTAETYHTHMLDVVIDVVDDGGSPILDGSPGNLVLTRLHAGPMPLIRYQVGDVGAVGTDRRCSCGRGFELLTQIDGRSSDVVVTPEGNRLIVHFFTGILEHFPEIDSFQVVQESADAIRLRLVPSQEFTREDEARIIAALRAKGAGEMRVDIELVNDIPLTAGGKRRFVIGQVN